MILPSITNLVQIFATKGVQHLILSPGSRCAPLTLAFVRHPDIATRTISDERSAAFIALGVARQLREPAGLLCTSGSAAYNYAPAVAEAFFQQIPLIILTADRPPEWIDQLDGQTIRQREIYGRHVKASYELPVGQTEKDIWYAGRIVSEAINVSQTYPFGPVHINVPVREPFYPEAGEELSFEPSIKVIEQISGEEKLSRKALEKITEEWSGYSRKLIVCGQQVYEPPLSEIIQKLGKEQHIPVVADVISNMHSVEEAVRHADVLLAQKNNETLQKLQPDLLITFGLSVISKSLKLFLRKFQPKTHWHIQPAGVAADTFQALTRVIHTGPTTFFNAVEEIKDRNTSQGSFYQDWQQEEKKAAQFIRTFFSGSQITRGSEFEAIKLMMQYLPSGINLHVANSMAVRYANLIGLEDKFTEVFANRGTSGIDGSNSTAVGSALTSEKLTVLITGDLAFFYDRNAFWHNYATPNLRVVILNNHGGGIFRMIEGPGRQPELDEYFETRQLLEAENTARDFNMEYHRVDLVHNRDLAKLKLTLDSFFNKSSGSAGILEIITDSKVNTRVFNQFKAFINNHSGA